MRKHYPKNLKKWQRFWEKEKIYKFNPQKKGKIFSIDTPPPTVSGKMHLGHAFSYTHLDIIARYQRMKGKNVFYPFGTDDNGLPTEKLVEKENKVSIFNMKRQDFVKLCQKTLKRIKPSFVQDWKDIGMSCDFDLGYSTIDKEVQKLSQRFFIELYEKKRIYQKETPTLWCPQCRTAIAQADLENKETETVFNDIIFKLENGKEILIATTRPELLSSCVAIFIHPSDKRYKNLIGKTAVVPIFKQKVKIYNDKGVDPKKGTGVVMCCTFGDTTDIEWYFVHHLPLKISINQDGTMTKIAGPFQGLKIKEARQRIIEELKKQGFIRSQKKIKHFVNVHERCNAEIEILNTSQWFIKYLDFKKDFLKMGRQIEWYPDFMRKRYENWVSGLRWDWCISRQRYFGIPFPVWYCQKCGEIRLARISDLPVDPLYSKPKTRCSCGSNRFIPETDILDTWATSSLTPKITIDLVKDEKTKKKLFPMSLRPQAHDIINFWLFYTIARSKLHFNKIPWKEVTISGFVLDPKGEKMSKSKGNVVAPQEVIEKYGVDVLRHWTAKASLGEDLRWNEEEIKASKRTVIKIWNAFRFSFMHLESFKKNNLIISNLEDEDRWILHLLEMTIKDYKVYFEKYQFKKSRETIDNFFWKNFCDNYLEIVKPRLYNNDVLKESKEAAKYTLYLCLFSIIKLYAPFMPYITEEVYQTFFRRLEKEKSIHLTLLPTINRNLVNPKIKEKFDNVIGIIGAIRKYKSEKKVSIRKEVNKLFIKSKNKEIKKYFNLIKSVMNIKSIKMKDKNVSGYFEVNSSIKIKII
ncbi:valine--tRNA ligase [Candidatus Parcubacteria bacterium]|nr:valine--tRNA ligase [Candidatus Parcubacteria bacterium]